MSWYYIWTQYLLNTLDFFKTHMRDIKYFNKITGF